MPNWCCTNYAIRGSKEDLMALVDKLNTMQNHPSDFGKYWMGNLLLSLGVPMDDVKYGNVRCRGAFDPDPYAVAQLCGPAYDENQKFVIDEDGILRLSAIHAWEKSDSLETFLKEKFPSLEFFFFSTDEFGNFHHFHDPEGLGKGFYPFHLNNDTLGSSYYYANEFDRFLQEFREECIGLDIPDDWDSLSSEQFAKSFLAWRDEDESRESYEYYVARRIQKT